VRLFCSYASLLMGALLGVVVSACQVSAARELAARMGTAMASPRKPAVYGQRG